MPQVGNIVRANGCMALRAVRPRTAPPRGGGGVRAPPERAGTVRRVNMGLGGHAGWEESWHRDTYGAEMDSVREGGPLQGGSRPAGGSAQLHAQRRAPHRPPPTARPGPAPSCQHPTLPHGRPGEEEPTGGAPRPPLSLRPIGCDGLLLPSSSLRYW